MTYHACVSEERVHFDRYIMGIRSERRLCDEVLYLAHGSIYDVREQAGIQDLRTKQRVTKTGKQQGGNLFERGHIYQILTNPIYAGKIRHHKKVFEGQHSAIIEPDVWEDVQQKLAASSAKQLGQANAAHPSPLAGKLFDETGDRLTPSHTNKTGKRLRYYISRRLVTDKRTKHPDAWRLPAPQLERAIAQAASVYFARQDLLPDLVEDLEAHEVKRLRDKTGALVNMLSSPDPHGNWSYLIAKASIAPGQLSIDLDVSALAEYLELTPERLPGDTITISTAFQLRRRGVETKIILGDTPPRLTGS